MGTRHDHSGLFKPGHAGGPGRPKRETEQAYLKTIIGKCTPEEWAKVVTKAIEHAQGDDQKLCPPARIWLSKYLVDPLLGDETAKNASEADDERFARIAGVLERIRGRIARPDSGSGLEDGVGGNGTAGPGRPDSGTQG